MAEHLSEENCVKSISTKNNNFFLYHKIEKKNLCAQKSKKG
jgi:hypothetical protein